MEKLREPGKGIRIGIDLHGVIDRDPEIWANTLKLFRKWGDEAWIVSGPPTDQIVLELSKAGLKLGVHYDGVASVVDFLKTSPGVEMWQDGEGRWWASDEDWWTSKGKICEEYGMETLIDDHEEYAPECRKFGVRTIIRTETGELNSTTPGLGLVDKSEGD